MSATVSSVLIVMMSVFGRSIWFTLVAVMAADARAMAGRAETVTVFDSVRLHQNREADMQWQDGDLHFVAQGQAAERSIDLPALPANLRDTPGITAIVEVRPVETAVEGAARPADPWTRLGSVAVILPDSSSKTPRPRGTMPANEDLPGRECEVIRFITGFGAAATYEQDVTALLPVLSGPVRVRVYLSTWESAGWYVTVRLRFDKFAAGPRRPKLCTPIFHEAEVTAQHPKLQALLAVPDGLSRPRLRIISTGHATDGSAGDEFTSRTHVLRVDGRLVAQWRPWTEAGGRVRDVNPWAGRRHIDGRELRASDFDRSGWTPGLVVEPVLIPVDELTPGSHQVELEILGIRPEDEVGKMGYWRVSAVVVADEPWPTEPAHEHNSEGRQ